MQPVLQALALDSQLLHLVQALLLQLDLQQLELVVQLDLQQLELVVQLFVPQTLVVQLGVQELVRQLL